MLSGAAPAALALALALALAHATAHGAVVAATSCANVLQVVYGNTIAVINMALY